ncbi:hypothetical protein IE81DRAFT_350397 [Ceraceosorus guamensis]|uniref:Zn(2)-C6 fungal-type domain-containing protein n=1 Tax=Ceraceosorus guamensis TaxID=1522189 RepID=A0A316VNH8_9BASI|nr:hypothetical protein IE81DRAFT_350397 [Ceraceosorus guamensis]PWN39189.1 hypothetical protein IE81DRAFT_350397 [Ceraceosorus guamensis]
MPPAPSLEMLDAGAAISSTQSNSSSGARKPRSRVSASTGTGTGTGTLAGPSKSKFRDKPMSQIIAPSPVTSLSAPGTSASASAYTATASIGSSANAPVDMARGSQATSMSSTGLASTSTADADAGAASETSELRKFRCPFCPKSWARQDLRDRHRRRCARRALAPSESRRRACNACAVSKVHCDEQRPSCGRCAARGEQCEWPLAVVMRTLREQQERASARAQGLPLDVNERKASQGAYFAGPSGASPSDRERRKVRPRMTEGALPAACLLPLRAGTSDLVGTDWQVPTGLPGASSCASSFCEDARSHSGSASGGDSEASTSVASSSGGGGGGLGDSATHPHAQLLPQASAANAQLDDAFNAFNSVWMAMQFEGQNLNTSPHNEQSNTSPSVGLSRFTPIHGNPHFAFSEPDVRISDAIPMSPAPQSLVLLQPSSRSPRSNHLTSHPTPPDQSRQQQQQRQPDALQIAPGVSTVPTPPHLHEQSQSAFGLRGDVAQGLDQFFSSMASSVPSASAPYPHAMTMAPAMNPSPRLSQNAAHQVSAGRTNPAEPLSETSSSASRQTWQTPRALAIPRTLSTAGITLSLIRSLAANFITSLVCTLPPFIHPKLYKPDPSEADSHASSPGSTLPSGNFRRHASQARSQSFSPMATSSNRSTSSGTAKSDAREEQVPYLPPPLFCARKVATLCLGAKTKAEANFAFDVLDLARTRLFDSDPNRVMDLERLAKTQALLVFQILTQLWGGQKHRSIACARQRDLIEAAAGLVESGVCNAPSEPNNWSEWLVAESKRRTVFAFVLLDVLIAVSNSTTPLTCTRILDVPLPSPSPLWSAPNESTWHAACVPTIPHPNFNEVSKILDTEEKVKSPSAFERQSSASFVNIDGPMAPTGKSILDGSASPPCATSLDAFGTHVMLTITSFDFRDQISVAA